MPTARCRGEKQLGIDLGPTDYEDAGSTPIPTKTSNFHHYENGMRHYSATRFCRFLLVHMVTRCTIFVTILMNECTKTGLLTKETAFLALFGFDLETGTKLHQDQVFVPAQHFLGCRL